MQPATAKFGSLELVTSPSVMTPRETSTGLVVCAAGHLEDRPGVVVDVGTGSGAIALAVAEAAPHAAVWATDVSSAAPSRPTMDDSGRPSGGCSRSEDSSQRSALSDQR